MGTAPRLIEEVQRLYPDSKWTPTPAERKRAAEAARRAFRDGRARVRLGDYFEVRGWGRYRVLPLSPSLELWIAERIVWQTSSHARRHTTVEDVVLAVFLARKLLAAGGGEDAIDLVGASFWVRLTPRWDVSVEHLDKD